MSSSSSEGTRECICILRFVNNFGSPGLGQSGNINQTFVIYVVGQRDPQLHSRLDDVLPDVRGGQNAVGITDDYQSACSSQIEAITPVGVRNSEHRDRRASEVRTILWRKSPEPRSIASISASLVNRILCLRKVSSGRHDARGALTE